jgi:hypothetical protein
MELSLMGILLLITGGLASSMGLKKVKDILKKNMESVNE